MNSRSTRDQQNECPINRESEKRERYREMSTLKECNTVKWQQLLQGEAKGSNNKRKQQALLVKYYL